MIEETKDHIKDFIVENTIGTQNKDGVYYNYSEVYKLLKLQEKELPYLCQTKTTKR